MKKLSNYVALFTALLLGAAFCGSTLDQYGLELLSESVYGEARPLMGSEFLDFVLQPAVAYAVIAGLVVVALKEFVIRTISTRLKINLAALAITALLWAVYMSAVYAPAPTAAA